MKKVVYSLTDVDVKLIKFCSSDPYDDFTDIPGRTVENVVSELDELAAIESMFPIVFFKQADGSYVLITKKSA